MQNIYIHYVIPAKPGINLTVIIVPPVYCNKVSRIVTPKVTTSFNNFPPSVHIICFAHMFIRQQFECFLNIFLIFMNWFIKIHYFYVCAKKIKTRFLTSLYLPTTHHPPIPIQRNIKPHYIASTTILWPIVNRYCHIKIINISDPLPYPDIEQGYYDMLWWGSAKSRPQHRLQRSIVETQRKCMIKTNVSGGW